MMNHEIRTFAMKDGKVTRELYSEDFRTAEEAHRAYEKVIEDHENLPERIRKPLMVARYADGRMMTMRVL